MIQFLGYNNMDYVYDIETVAGTFQAGVGEMIVKNTDSCYVIFPESVNPDGTLKNLFKLAQTAADEISKTFKKPIELEFEKFMYPLILVAKKRYMYLEWTNPETHNGCIEAKGVELVRRDNCPYVKETLDAVLKPIFFENNLDTGIKQAELYIDRLLNGEVDIKKLILSKNLRNDYKGYKKDKKGKWVSPNTTNTTNNTNNTNTTNNTNNTNKVGNLTPGEDLPSIAHVVLVEKIRLRDPNAAPKPGDRVPFVYIDIGNPKALSWEKIEDPGYVIENKKPIDTLYYLEHQLKNPLKTIFDILLGPERCEKLFQRKSLTDAKRREKESIANNKRIKERKLK
jgi:DNA polymerase elongation subunit (family B)